MLCARAVGVARGLQDALLSRAKCPCLSPNGPAKQPGVLLPPSPPGPEGGWAHRHRCYCRAVEDSRTGHGTPDCQDKDVVTPRLQGMLAGLRKGSRARLAEAITLGE